MKICFLIFDKSPIFDSNYGIRNKFIYSQHLICKCKNAIENYRKNVYKCLYKNTR